MERIHASLTPLKTCPAVGDHLYSQAGLISLGVVHTVTQGIGITQAQNTERVFEAARADLGLRPDFVEAFWRHFGPKLERLVTGKLHGVRVG